jgi:histidyl-tRNA synthetase
VANKLAKKIILLGEDEVKTGVLTMKDFASGEQTKIARADLITATF